MQKLVAWRRNRIHNIPAFDDTVRFGRLGVSAARTKSAIYAVRQYKFNSNRVLLAMFVSLIYFAVDVEPFSGFASPKDTIGKKIAEVFALNYANVFVTEYELCIALLVFKSVHAFCIEIHIACC